MVGYDVRAGTSLTDDDATCSKRYNIRCLSYDAKIVDCALTVSTNALFLLGCRG